MKRQPIHKSKGPDEKAVSEILILSDGKIFAHNITPAMAGVLAKLNPSDAAMSRRATPKKI